MNLLDKIKEYYPRIDAGDVDWVIDLFADDSVYQLADAVYRGKLAISDFYTKDRKIQGKHSLESALAENEMVIVNGVFEGVGADGSAKSIGFADAWQFDTHGQVVSRKTYLAAGSDYVKD